MFQNLYIFIGKNILFFKYLCTSSVAFKFSINIYRHLLSHRWPTSLLNRKSIYVFELNLNTFFRNQSLLWLYKWDGYAYEVVTFFCIVLPQLNIYCLRILSVIKIISRILKKYFHRVNDAVTTLVVLILLRYSLPYPPFNLKMSWSHAHCRRVL